MDSPVLAEGKDELASQDMAYGTLGVGRRNQEPSGSCDIASVSCVRASVHARFDLHSRKDGEGTCGCAAASVVGKYGRRLRFAMAVKAVQQNREGCRGGGTCS